MHYPEYAAQLKSVLDSQGLTEYSAASLWANESGRKRKSCTQSLYRAVRGERVLSIAEAWELRTILGLPADSFDPC